MFSAAVNRFKRVFNPLYDKREGENIQTQGHIQSPSIPSKHIKADALWSGTGVASRAQQLNDASKERFQYGDPLQETDIRLLQLQPGSGDDPVICSLIICPLEGCFIPYEAVSYVWGSEDNPHSITCNWTSPSVDGDELMLACPDEVTNNMTVTDNLYHFMLRFRHPIGLRTLWIDQICINQDNNPDKLEEKMAQVRRMAEVYDAADNVLIWLGEEDSETATAFGMMKWMAATINMPVEEIGNLIEYLETTEDFSNNKTGNPNTHKQNMEYLKSLLVHVQPRAARNIEDPDSTHWHPRILLGGRSLQGLLQRAWFTRSWTFQETISARSATVMCGSHDLQWETLYQACKSMEALPMVMSWAESRINIPFVVESVIKKGDLQRDWARVKRISSCDRAVWSPDDVAWLESGFFYNQRKIKSLLPLLRPTACKDPRDKVLALLGISHDDQRWIRFPDYKLPVVNLYTCTVSYWVRDIGKMDISFLHHVQDSDPEHKLPSWVPDWSTPAVTTPLIDVADFSASGSTTPQVFMDDTNYLGAFKPFPDFPPLAIEGFLIMEVQDVEADLTNYKRHAEMMNMFENPYPTTQFSYSEAYQRTLFPKIPEGFQPIERVKGTPTFWEHNNNHKSKNHPLIPESCEAVNDTTFLPRCTARQLQSLLPDSSTLLQISIQMQHSARAPAPGRSFFVSNTGFIGLCPKQTVPGDDICILLGAATPFVIRFADDKIVRFVGESFVLGVMHGEAMEGRPKKREMVILR